MGRVVWISSLLRLGFDDGLSRLLSEELMTFLCFLLLIVTIEFLLT